MTEPSSATSTAQVTVPGAAQMRALGARLALLLRPGDLVVLTGPLGAGKTTLVQGIGAGLAVRGPVTSPTFVIARVHPALRGGPDLVHADAYRLGSRVEVDDLDLDADLESSVVVVEWGEGLVEYLAPGYLLITLDRVATPPPGGQGSGDDPGDEPRLVTVTGHGDRWQGAAAEFVKLLTEPPGPPDRPGPPDQPRDDPWPAGRAVRLPEAGQPPVGPGGAGAAPIVAIRHPAAPFTPLNCGDSDQLAVLTHGPMPVREARGD